MSDQYQKEFASLVDIIARLRGPEGCPWDKKQTHTSLREFLLEETYEVLEALDEEDHRKLCQELGDLLLQIILHARIASEKGEFELEEVLKTINEKLVRRHPHIFGNVQVQDAAEVSHNWEAIKKGNGALKLRYWIACPVPCRRWPIVRIFSAGQPRLVLIGKTSTA